MAIQVTAPPRVPRVGWRPAPDDALPDPPPAKALPALAVRGAATTRANTKAEAPARVRPVRPARPADFGMGPLFGRVRDGAVVADAERGTIVLWNPAAAALFGYAAAEAVGQSLEILIPESLRARHRAGLARYAATGHGAAMDAGTALELPALRKDGTALTVELTLSAIEAGARSPFRGRFVLALIRDVTARRRAQRAALTRQAALLEAQYEASPDAILVVSPAGEVVSCNRRFRDLWPLPPPLPGAAPAAPGDRAAVEAMLATLADPEPFRARIAALGACPDEASHDELRLLDGRTFDCHSTPVTAPSGAHYGRVWYLRDITDRKRMAETLRASEGRYRQLVELSPDLVAVHAGGVIRYINAAGLALAGAATAAEMVGRPVRDFVHPASLPTVLERARQGQEERRGMPLAENTFLRLDGREIALEIVSIPVEFEGQPAVQVVGRDITGRQRAAAALRFQAAVLEAVGQAVVASDLDGRITYWNRAAEALYGWTADEALDRSASLMVPADADPANAAAIFAALRRGETWSGEFPMLRRDGTRFPALVTNTPVRDAGGHVSGVIAISQDITGRKQVEVALQESEGRYRAVVEQSADGIAIADGPTYVFANQAAAHLFGLREPSQVVGRTVDSFLAPEERERVLALAAARQAGAPAASRYEVQLDRADGARRTVEIAATRVTYRGRPASLAITRDVTERRAAERHLQRLNGRLRLLLDIASSLTATLEPDAQLDGLLQQVVGLLPGADVGAIYLYEPASGRLLPRACVGLDPVAFGALCLRPGESPSGRVFRSCRAGAPGGQPGAQPGGSLSVPLRTPDGTLVGTLAVGSSGAGFAGDDLALLEGVASQAALALQNARLFAQARRDARELKDALTELRAAEASLVQRERLRALGEMAGGIAHDFNNALTPVVGYSELLLTQPEVLADPERTRRYLELIAVGAQDAAGVVRRLRDFYRQRAADDELTPVALPELVAQVVALTRPKWKDQAQADGRTIEVLTDLRPVPPVLGEEGELRELLTNLLFNAVDAIPGRGTITVRTRHAGERVRLEVSDSGIGMTEAVRRRCLEPFFSTKDERGTGLGLAVAHGIVQRHHGELAITSVPGEGTTVTLHLPVVAPAAALAPTPAAAPPPPLNVLHVDDDPAVGEVVAACLRAEGHTVQTAASGRAALAWLGGAHFDAVITDSAMPGLSGRQLAVLCKTVAPTTPVILLTGFGDLMAAAGELPPGISRVLGKPVTRDTLRATLAALIPGGSPTGAGVSPPQALQGR
jgi:PAS domain S-box-containing protein